jgi:hypothetical protein
MSAAVKEDVVPAGVVRFLIHNLEDILGRHSGNMTAAPQVELRMLLDAIGELRSPPR